jgi:hypothetical protein
LGLTSGPSLSSSSSAEPPALAPPPMDGDMVSEWNERKRESPPSPCGECSRGDSSTVQRDWRSRRWPPGLASRGVLASDPLRDDTSNARDEPPSAESFRRTQLRFACRVGTWLVGGGGSRSACDGELGGCH